MRPATKDIYLRDNEIKGFICKCSVAGTRTFIFEYKDRARTTRRVTIGRHGILTVSHARRRATQLSAERQMGGNPGKERSDRSASPTVNALAKLWLNEGVPSRRRNRAPTKAKTIRDYEGWLLRHILPAIGKMKAEAVESAHIEKIMRSLNDRKTTANRCLAVVSSLFGYAIRKKLATTNPASGVDRFEESKMERILTTEELQLLGDVLKSAEQAGENQSGVDCVRLLLATGARTSEIVQLRWKQVDFDQEKIHLPDSKTGEGEILLGGAATELLHEIHKRHTDDGYADLDCWVIPGAAGGHLKSLSKLWARWRDRAGISDCRLHDLRHSFASKMANNGVPLIVIAGLLRHASIVTTERYTHADEKMKRSAANAVSSQITGTLNRNE